MEQIWIKQTPEEEEKTLLHLSKHPYLNFCFNSLSDHPGSPKTLMNKKGEILSFTVGDESMIFWYHGRDVREIGELEYDAICIKNNGKYGLLGQESLLTEIIYEERFYPSQFGYFPVVINKKILLLNIKGELLHFIFDEIQNDGHDTYEDWWSTLHNYFKAKVDGKWGIIRKADMTAILPFEYDTIDNDRFDNIYNIFSVSKNGKFGLFIADNHLVLSPIYDKPFDWQTLRTKSNHLNGQTIIFDSDWSPISKESELKRNDVIKLIALSSCNSEQNPLLLEGVDFTLEDLSRLNLNKSSFKRAILQNTKFNNADLSFCNFTNAKIDQTEFINANLSNVILPNSNKGNYSSAKFENFNLNLADINPLKTSFKSATFFKSYFIFYHLDVYKEDIKGKFKLLANAVFESCKLESILSGMDLQSAAFIDCNFRNVFFRNCFFASGTLRNIKTLDTNFENCSFVGNQTIANMEGKFIFTNCNFEDVQFYKLSKEVVFKNCTFNGNIVKDSTWDEVKIIDDSM